MTNREVVTFCIVCGKSLTEEQSRSPDPEVHGAGKAMLDFCIPHYIDSGYQEQIEHSVKLRIITNKRGRKYHRLEVEIELPAELKDWQLVPSFLYGVEASKYPNEQLTVPMRKRKDIRNVRR